ncbi:hypothetical protein [Howardella ureilytica]|nr:hypothetical protein [Lachnospiraceae bacterium]MDY2956277.1 hypothetical protein [Lachnospiraceae bacterium]
MSEHDCNIEKLCVLIDRHKFVSFNDFLFYLKQVKDKDVVEFAKKNQDSFKSYIDKINKVDDDTYEFFM